MNSIMYHKLQLDHFYADTIMMAWSAKARNREGGLLVKDGPESYLAFETTPRCALAPAH